MNLLQRLMGVGVVVFTLCLSLPASAQLKYHTFEELTQNLAPKEVEKLKEILDKTQIVDLEESNLSELSKWIDTLKERVTGVIEKRGMQYPFYKIYVTAVPEVDAFIYKYRPNGHAYYRGYVFISIGLIDSFVKSLGLTQVNDATVAVLAKLMQGLQGVAGHEVAHPKEDEVVKWDWRAANDGSRQDHSQADESATDLMGTSILREAGLEPESVLYAIQLLPVPNQSNENSFLSGAKAGVSSHPETEMRINIIRGYLTQDRMDKGFPKVNPIPYQPEAMKRELSTLLDYLSVEKQIKNDFAGSAPTLFQAGIKAIRKNTSDLKDDFGHVDASRFDRYLQYLDFLGQFKIKDLTAEDEAAFVSYLEDMDTNWSKLFATDNWFIYTGSSGSGYAQVPEFRDVRLLQRKFRKIDAFQLPKVREFIAEYLERDLGKTLLNPVGTIESLLTYLPASDTMKIIQKGMEAVPALPEVNAVDFYLTTMHAAQLGNGPIELEVDAVNKFTALLKSSEAARERASHVFQNYVETLNKTTQFHERFARARAKGPALKDALVEAYAQLALTVLSLPKVFAGTRAMWVNNCAIYKPLLWSKKPNLFLGGIGTNTAANQWLVDEVAKISRNPEWKAAIRAHIEKTVSQTLVDRELQPVPKLTELLVRSDFNPRKTNRLLLDLLVENGLRFDEAHHIVIKEMLPAGYRDKPYFLNGYVEKFPADQRKDVIVELLSELDQSDTIAEYLSHLKHAKLIDDATYGELMAEHEIPGNEEGYVPNSALYSHPTAFAYWRHLREQGITGSAALKAMLEKFRIDKFDEANLDGSSYYNDDKSTVRALKQTGMLYHPEYSRLFHLQTQGIVADFRREVGDVKANFDKAYSYLSLIFNPDDKPINNQYKKILNFSNLDKLAKELVPFIPDDLTYDQHFKMWTMISAKRINKFTDNYFMKHILPTVSKNKDLKVIEPILKNGLIRSERVRVEFIEVLLEPELGELAKNKGHLTDRQVNDFIQKIQYYTSDTSRFRDEYLETVAWKLQLTERQLTIFIEPLKSFNYKSMDPNLVNLLSTMSSLMQELTTKEMLDFIRYVRSPTESIFTAIPRLEKILEVIAPFLRKSVDELKTGFEKLESMVRDAGENERLVLIESVVGTRRTGLWYKGEEVRQELYTIAGIKDDKKSLFLTYLKALPEWEHTIVLSYLLASSDDASDSDVLRICELFQTPGMKFAQMASIFNLFGDEESAKLAAAKFKAKPPTRLGIFEILKERFSESDYKMIKSIDKRLGSGGIKYVVSVTLENGKRYALYVRRPWIEESTDTILGIAEKWMTFLKDDPELKNFMDYDYYLTSLREQLNQEIKFINEAKSSHRMAGLYEKVRPYKGWKYKGVRPADDLPKSEDLYFYELVDNAVMFDDLSPEDQKVVGEYIIDTELDFLFSEGDGDRHLGNYLFDPRQKIVYPLDMGQHFTLQKSWLFPDEPYAMAKVLYAMSLEDRSKGADILFEAFDRMRVSPALTIDAQAKLKARMVEILNSKDPQIARVLDLLAELNNARLRLPFRITLGMIKGLSIVLNEKYAKAAGQDYVNAKVRARVKGLMIKGKLKDFAEKTLGWARPAAKPPTEIDCNEIVHVQK